MLVADSTSNGFLGTPSLAGDLTSANDPGVLVANASVTMGSTFGGDLIIGKLSVTTAGTLPAGFTIDNVAAIQGKNFALYYFPALTLASSSVPNSTSYGVVQGIDWILPAVNGGELFTTSSTPANYAAADVFARVIATVGPPSSATNDNFTTSGSPAFMVGGAIPEPSAALLGALGALGLLRRRRI